MKEALLVCQSQDGSYVNLIRDALWQNGYRLTVITGKNSDIRKDVTVVQKTKYDANSFLSRFRTWFAFTGDVRKYFRESLSRFDLVMFTSNPPVNQRLVRMAQRSGKKTVYLIWDIYPDCIEKSFGKKVAPVTALWRRINRRMYSRCDAVLTIGEVMKRNILKSYPRLDVQVIPYHTDTGFIHPVAKEENPFVRSNGLSGKKVFMYSGKMGFGHGFTEMLEAAKLLKDRQDIQFMFIGHGAAYGEVETFIRNNGMENATVMPYQPLEMLPYSLGSADVAFVTIKAQTDGLFLPSKVYDAMASGSAIIAISAGNNDVAALTDAGVGLNVRPGDPEAVAQAVLRLADDPAFLAQCQQKAAQTAKQYDIAAVTEQYAALFRRILEGEAQ